MKKPSFTKVHDVVKFAVAVRACDVIFDQLSKQQLIKDISIKPMSIKNDPSAFITMMGQLDTKTFILNVLW